MLTSGSTRDPIEALMTDARLTRIETALAHQDRLIEDLDIIVRDQAQRIVRLERRIEALAAGLRAAREDNPPDGAPPVDPPPPHW